MSTRAPDSERDAWLSEALRHAPDANADAPAAISEVILREAYRAAAGRPAPRRAHRPGRFASAWDWLARPRVAAGFASVAVATLAGMMWWGEPLDPTARQTPDTVPTLPQAQVGDPAAAPAAPRTRTDEPAKAAPSAPAPRAVQRAAEHAGGPAEPAAMPGSVPAAGSGSKGAAAKQSAPSQARPKSAVAESRARASAQIAAPDTGAAALAASPLVNLRTSIAQQPGHWSWQRGGSEPRPMMPALERWLAQLDQSATSRWRSAAPMPPADRAAALTLWRDGVLQATLGFGPATVWVETGDGRSPQSTPASAAVSLPAPATEALRQALDDATR